MKENAKIEALKAELKILNAERRALREKYRIMFRQWMEMEGKYALDIIPDEDGGQGTRGYFFKYADGMKEKENAEREAFRIKMNKETDTTELDEKIYEIKNALCIERHGYDLAEQDRRRWATDTRADIKALERELAEKREYLKELER